MEEWLHFKPTYFFNTDVLFFLPDFANASLENVINNLSSFLSYDFMILAAYNPNKKNPVSLHKNYIQLLNNWCGYSRLLKEYLRWSYTIKMKIFRWIGWKQIKLVYFFQSQIPPNENLIALNLLCLISLELSLIKKKIGASLGYKKIYFCAEKGNNL